MKDNTNNSKISPFARIWGTEVESGGYTQIPNDLLRNLGALDISPNQMAVLLIIISHQEGRKISAAEIAHDLNLSIKTVRNIFRTLQKKEFLYRYFPKQRGEANSFAFTGTVTAVANLAKIRKRSMQKQPLERVKNVHSPMQNLHTNKEENTSNTEKMSGFEKYKSLRKERNI